jgi:hypothetical protein
MSEPDHAASAKTVSHHEVVAGFAAGLLTALAFGLGGFFLVYDDTGSMGWVLFLALPFATGFATALVARGRAILIASLLIALLMSTAVLLFTRFEGFVCVLMSLPLLAIGMAVGALLGVLFRVHVIAKLRHPRPMMLFILFVIPLFLMGANYEERTTRRMLRAQTVTDTLIVDASPEAVWNELKRMDNISASKTFLMKIGLPIPVSCQTEGEGVGGKRTCYFEHGFIEERITEWNYPNSMKFDIVASEVPGRPWLTFRDAGYEIRREGTHTMITRQTTILSRLSPVWYWRRLEAVGVHTEHQYLFEALDNKLKDSK